MMISPLIAALFRTRREAPQDGSPGRTRTCDPPVNSRLLYQLSYRGSAQGVRSYPRTLIGASTPRRDGGAVVSALRGDYQLTQRKREGLAMAGRSWALALAFAAGATAASTVLASGGGGMGGGSMPTVTTPQYDPVQEYQQGMSDYQAGNYKSADRHFDNVTYAQGHDANAWYMLGIARSGAGDLKGAEKALSKSAKLDAG